MKYEKLSKRALGCMVTAELVAGVVVLGIVAALWYFWLGPHDVAVGKLVAVLVGLYTVFSMTVEPFVRFYRYRYAIDEECIDIKEGYFFVKRHIVPIERLHKLETAKGPIDQLFRVAKVTVTTAGGDVTIRFLDEEKAEVIADTLRTRINEIVREQRDGDGE